MWLDNIDAWMGEIERCNTHVMKLRPGRACLMVIDMQNEFLAADGSIFFHYAAEIVPRVKRLLAACRKAGIPVIYTGHVHEDPSIDGGMTAEWWPEIKKGQCLIKGTKGVDIYGGIKPRKHEKVIWKHRYSAFYNTDLETVLLSLIHI